VTGGLTDFSTSFPPSCSVHFSATLGSLSLSESAGLRTLRSSQYAAPFVRSIPGRSLVTVREEPEAPMPIVRL
jgi:hypothetical protein